jgi:alkanesulfonate monooxygenase SsuD/methylene tetrahydromethanopterin reductase-like flavin-dependent oxidoreductase (luciferase family)
MQVGVSLIVRGNDAMQQNLATMATEAEAWGFDSVWASDRLSIVQHLVLELRAGNHQQRPGDHGALRT